MRSLKFTLMALALLLGMSLVVFAGDAETSKAIKASETPKELKNQTHCPVMGGKIDSTVYTDIQGQRVYHCCPGCSPKLTADPDKYFKQAAADGIFFENIQTTCPVSGKELEDKSVFIDYEGRRVVFCCEKCISAFKKEPSKHLANLSGGAKADAEKKMEKTDHSGHNH